MIETIASRFYEKFKTVNLIETLAQLSIFAFIGYFAVSSISYLLFGHTLMDLPEKPSGREFALLICHVGSVIVSGAYVLFSAGVVTE